MNKLILYIATSLDGYIAAPDGGVDWLDSSTDVGYHDFLKTIDAIIMGRTTYDQVLTFGPWPYGDIPCYVFTNRNISNPPAGVVQVHGPAGPAYQEICRHGYGNIWLEGGAKIASAFRELHLIDEYRIYLQPVWLGDGIPLFTAPLAPEEVKLHSTRTFPNGMVELVYTPLP